MDTDRIPTEPTTDHVPPSVTSLTPGPSQAPTSPAAGRGRRTGVIGAVVGIALVATFSAGIGVGSLLVAAASGPTATTPDPASPGRLRPSSGHPGSLGHDPPRVRRARRAGRPGAHLGRHRRHDPGRRRHRPHRLHDPRGARAAQQVAERLVRRDRRPHRPDRGRACRASSACSRTARPRRPACRSTTSSSRSTASRPPARPSTRSPALVRGEAGTTVSRDRPGRRHRPGADARHRPRRRADPARLVDHGARARRPPSSVSTSSPAAPPTRSSRPSRTRGRPAPSGSSWTCAATRAATSTKRSASPASS